LADLRILISCEHGGNEVPPAWQHLFYEAIKTLSGHEGYDPGALQIARVLADQLHSELYFTTISRLLVDCNRSRQHPRLFSRYTKGLSHQEKQEILSEHYLPYRTRTEQAVSRAIGQGGRVLHISVHTFAPHMHGKARNNDIGLLYDPARKSEKDFCVAWQQRLREISPKLRVRRNYPYLGKTDGLVTACRKKHGPDHYLGVELELNQGLFLQSGKSNRVELAEILVRSLMTPRP
jgi:predicted N-formylglutamate amidohydrolase